jgi:hypothetical protein
LRLLRNSRSQANEHAVTTATARTAHVVSGFDAVPPALADAQRAVGFLCRTSKQLSDEQQRAVRSLLGRPLGAVGTLRRDIEWNIAFAALSAHAAAYGDVDEPTGDAYVGCPLADWADTQRLLMIQGKPGSAARGDRCAYSGVGAGPGNCSHM